MHPKATRQIVFASDLAWISISAITAYFLRTGISWTGQNLQTAFYGTLFLMTVSGIAWAFVFYRLKLDGFYGGYSFAAVLSQLFCGVTVLVVLVASVGYLTKDYMSRLLISYFAGLLFFGTIAIRGFARGLANRLSDTGKRHRVVILGKGRIAQEIAERIKRHPEMRWEVVGFLFPSRDDFGESFVMADRNVQLNTLQIESLLKEEQVEEIVIASPGLEQTEILNLIANCRRRGIQISVVPHLYELHVTRPSLIDLDGLPLLALAENRPTLFQKTLKRNFDILLSLAALIVSSPLLLISTILLWTRNRRVFSSEPRCGRDGQIFRMYRFVTDRANGDVSSFDGLLQKLSITELPQLINVLKGDMSLVGPRPEPENRAQRYSDWQRQRLVVKPGMTGLAQVHGLREENSSEDKAFYDLRYIQNLSLLADASLILQTLWTIASRFLPVSKREPDLITSPENSTQPVGFAHADRP